MTSRRSFELVDESSNKFWEVWVDGSKVMTRFGKVGSQGQTKIKDEGSAEQALKTHDKLVREKTAKGYVENLEGGAPDVRAQATNERLAKAIGLIKGWMLKNRASKLAKNLAGGASAAQLAKTEAALGFALPSDLRDLWALHNGQKEEMNGFVEWLDLFGTERALGEQDSVQLFVKFLRESPDDWEKAGVTAEEVRSNHWVPFAGRDSDSIVVSGISGRVFNCGKDAPPLKLIAESVSKWADQYAARVVADDYEVVDGFGDYHLSLRDRAAEQRQQERAKKQKEEARYRRQTPLLAQLQDAMTQGDVSLAQDVFEAAAKSPSTLSEAVELLFGAKREPQFIAKALQMVLNAVTLSREQWSIVAKGGALIENNAIRDIATARLRDVV